VFKLAVITSTSFKKKITKKINGGKASKEYYYKTGTRKFPDCEAIILKMMTELIITSCIFKPLNL
jgi:hypothetical protein